MDRIYKNDIVIPFVLSHFDMLSRAITQPSRWSSLLNPTWATGAGCLKSFTTVHHESDCLWFLLTADVEGYNNNNISDFFFSCLRFSTLAKMVLRSQCLLFTRKELNWMVLILPSYTDMEASTYQLHQATGKQGNLYLLLKYLVLSVVTDWGQGGLWIWQNNAFQVPKMQDGGHKDCTSVSRHHLSALLVLNSRDLPRVTEEIHVRAEESCALLRYTAGTLLNW